MKKIPLILLCVAAAAMLHTSPAWAFGWYVGGGLESVTLGDDLDGVDDGTGLVLNFGYQYSPTISLDFMLSSSAHEEDVFFGDVVYGKFLVGGKFTFMAPMTVQPFLTVGLGSHAISFDFFDDITGVGLYVGGGADFYLDPNNRISIGYRTMRWDGEDSFVDYDVDTNIFSMVYNFQFTY